MSDSKVSFIIGLKTQTWTPNSFLASYIFHWPWFATSPTAVFVVSKTVCIFPVQSENLPSQRSFILCCWFVLPFKCCNLSLNSLALGLNLGEHLFDGSGSHGPHPISFLRSEKISPPTSSKIGESTLRCHSTLLFPPAPLLSGKVFLKRHKHLR